MYAFITRERIYQNNWTDVTNAAKGEDRRSGHSFDDKQTWINSQKIYQEWRRERIYIVDFKIESSI